MKTIAAAAIILFAASGAQARVAVPEDSREVTVCLDSGLVPVMARVFARATAARMFADIGVIVHWRTGRCPADAIRVRIVGHSMGGFSPDALAYARPNGEYAEVFWDRIMAESPTHTEALLAHVLVHEITHILQGVARHSETGVMKAHWGPGDMDQLARKPLPFAPEDVNLIRAGLDERTRLAGYRLASTVPAASPAPPASSR